MSILRNLILAGLAAAVTTATTIIPASSQDADSMSCGELWYARNKIYKDYGYCFQTKAGRDTFGNAGCSTRNADALGLSSQDSRMIDRYVRAERNKRCPKSF